MKTIISEIDENNIDINEIRKQAKFLKEGKTVIFPTETVYAFFSWATGLGALAIPDSLTPLEI